MEADTADERFQKSIMRKWTVGKRITVGFASVILIALALGAFAYRELIQISQYTQKEAEESLPVLQACETLRINMKQNLGIVFQHIGSENKDDMAALEQQMREGSAGNNKLYEGLERLIRTPQARILLEKAVAARSVYIKQRDEALAISRQVTNNAAAYRFARAQVTPLADKYDAELAALAGFCKDEADAATKSIQSATTSSKLGILIGLIGALCVGMAVSFAITRTTNRVLSHVAEELGEGAAHVVRAADQVAASSQSLAEGSSQQAASLEETSSSLEELSSMTRRNSQNSQQADALAKEARTAAEKGSADMRQMTAAMEGLKTSSDDIAKIIKTIDEIAFQTNILALNAAVEAARAGEAGMGFAVVADEVRSLAQRCATAAKETSAKIEGTIAKTKQGVEISAEVDKALADIVSRAREVDRLVAEVAGATHEQSQGIDQINKAVSEMDKVTQSNAASAEESAAAAQELNAQSQSVQGVVGELLALVGSADEKSKPAAGSARPGATQQSKSPTPASPKSPGKTISFNKAKRNTEATSRHDSGEFSTVSARRSELPLDGDFKDF